MEIEKQIPTTSQKIKSLLFAIFIGTTLPQVIAIILYKAKFKYALAVWYLFATVFLFLTYKYCQNRHYLNFTKVKFFRGTICAIIGIITAYIFFLVFPDSNGTEVTKGAESIQFLLFCLMGPIWEEIIFRDIILKQFFNNSTLGIIISSVLFAFFHGYFSPVLFFYFVMGLILSFANRGQEDLSTSITTHVLYNTIIVVGSIFFT
jgi:membrane protease YdiL (CAAX protease family)